MATGILSSCVGGFVFFVWVMLALIIAVILRGKNKATYTPAADTGDFIVAINADKIKLTGNKMNDKIYYKHTGFMGGLKEITAKHLMAKDATALITKAVKGMLPKGPLGRKQLKKLKVYVGNEHPHAAQHPQELQIKIWITDFRGWIVDYKIFDLKFEISNYKHSTQKILRNRAT